MLIVISVMTAGVAGVVRSVVSSSSSSASTGVGKSQVTVDERCDGQMQQVQSAVIQLLSAQYEHKRSIDKLQMLTDHVQKDITHIKSRIEDLDTYTTADKIRNTVSSGNHGDVSSAASKPGVYGSQSLVSSASVASPRDEEESRRRDERLLVQSQLLVNKSLETVTSRLDNITALLAKEIKRIHDLDRRYKRLQRSLADSSKVTHHHETVAKTTGGERVQQDEADMEHFVNKQREINGNLQNRLRNLEQHISPQSDQPAVSVQTGVAK